MRDRKTSEDYMKQMPRRWQAGEVYAPRDLSPTVVQKFKKRTAPLQDITDKLDLNPLDMYKVSKHLLDYDSSTNFGWIPVEAP